MSQTTQQQYLDQILANQRKLFGQHEEILQFKKDIDAGKVSVQDEEARKRETKALVEEIIAAQRAHNHEFGVPQGQPPVDLNTGNLLPDVERQLNYRGLFGKFGENTIPYEKMVGEMNPRHPWIKNKNASEVALYQDLMETHDAAAFLREYIWATYKQQPEALKYAKWLKHPDVREHLKLRVMAGYLDPNAINFKANEIMNPVALSSLDFTFLSSNLLMFLELESDLDREFVQFTMPRMNFTINIQTNHARGYLGGQAANNPPFRDQTTGVVPMAPNTMFSQLAFSPVTFAANYNIVILPYNDQIEEDSIIPWLPKMREEAGIGWLRSRNDAIVNGDTTATHMDSDVTDARDYRKAWIGMRRASLANVKVDFAGPTSVTDLDAMIEKQGVYGVNPAESRFVVGASQVHDIRHLAEVSDYTTWGPGNTYPVGVVGVYRGRNIRMSPWIRENTNASGVYDGVTTTKGVCHLVNVRRGWMGVMRAAITETQREATALVTYVVTNIREDFQFVDKHVQTSDQFNGPTGPVVTGYNITL